MQASTVVGLSEVKAGTGACPYKHRPPRLSGIGVGPGKSDITV